MPIYSHGTSSPIKVELTKEQAESYNRVILGFLDEQMRLIETGTPWNQDKPIEISCREGDMETYNAVARLFNESLAAYAKPVSEDEITSDFLKKN